jgi:hypothetical protein
VLEASRDAENGAPADGTAPDDGLELVALPLVAQGGAFGSVTFGRAGFSPGDHVLAIELSRRLANALENARLYARERKIAETLQQSLLPRRVPEGRGGAPVGALSPRHRPRRGGDFWDVIELPMQRLLLVVGDVAGRGEPAAIVMGRLRTVIRAVADTDVTPASLIASLNRFLVDHEDEMATCLCAVLDQTTGTVRVANAGTPAAAAHRRRRLDRLLRRRDRRAAGRSPVHHLRRERFTVAPGDTLVLFTDGLIERRGEPIDARLELLAERSREAVAGGSGWCDAIVDAMIGARRDDDVALLGRPHRSPAPARAPARGSRRALLSPRDPRADPALARGLGECRTRTWNPCCSRSVRRSATSQSTRTAPVGDACVSKRRSTATGSSWSSPTTGRGGRRSTAKDAACTSSSR